MSKAKCTKGWFDRCSQAKTHKCTCSCGGANHGRESGGLGGVFGGMRKYVGDQASLFQPTKTKDYKKWIAVKKRKLSPELDFGVHWYHLSPREWPKWRISWIENTGELYATNERDVEIIGIIKERMTLDQLHKKNLSYSELKIEKILKGWADHHELDWVRNKF